MVSPPPIELATLGWEDSLILMVLALVVFGPRRLPLIGRQIGKLMYEFRKASNDFKFQMEEELRAAEDADRRKKEEAERQRVAALAASSQASVSAEPQTTVESVADVGAVEPPATGAEYPEQYPSETAAAETALTVQPPSTGEQVSAPRPNYHFGVPETQGPEPAAMAEVNPEADAEANAAGVEAQVAANGSRPAAGTSSEPQPDAPNPEVESAKPKEPVSQNG
jgi:sec-independent protein translocase protein TatB